MFDALQDPVIREESQWQVSANSPISIIIIIKIQFETINIIARI